MSWTLVFKQTAPYSFTQSLSTLQTTQVNTSTDANYSILNELYNTNTRTNYEISSGRYRFKVVDDQGREMIFEQDNLWDVVDEDPIVSNPSPSPNPVIISVTGFTLPESGTTFEFDGYMVSPSQWQYISRFNGLLGIAGRFHLGQETYFNDGTPQLSVFSTGNGTILYANTLELYVETPITVINFASLTSQPSQTNQSLNFNSTVNAFLTNNGFTNWAYNSINFTDSGQIIPGVNSAALDSNTYTYTTAIAIHYSYSSTLLLEKQYSESKRVTIYYGSALIGGPGDTIVRKNGVQIDSANVTQKEVTVYVAAGDTLTIVEETADVALIYAIVETTTGTTADQTVPVITLLGDATVNVQYNTTYTDAGATATDDTDGDITSSIITTSTVNTSTIGAYSVKYNATDAAGNTATEVIRVVNVVDLTKPTITLTGSSTVTTSVGRTYSDAGATATDNVDGDLTSSITTVSTVDMTAAGIYSITFNVTDAAGNTAVPAVRTIIVEDNVPALSTDTGSVNTVASASISTQDLTSAAVVGNSAAQKREYTKNAVINMFAKNANALSGKKLVLQTGAVLPGFSESLAEDTILIDGRVSATLNKLDFINKSFYIPMEVNSVVSLDSFNDTVTITQNENDFTIATSTLTTTKVAGDSFSYDHLNIMLGSVYGSLSAPIICFKEGTKITCLDVKTNQDIELPIETIPPNTYVKTYKHGYIQVKKITNHKLENPDSREILKGRLYIYEPCNTTPGLYEPLIMTGCHSALVDSITPEQQQLMEEQVGNTFITDDKYRLMCMYDTRAEPYTVSGIYTIWHICLEHYDEEMNYGIYANGLLVESCSKKNIELMVDTPEPA